MSASSGCGRSERAHHRRGHVGIAAQRCVGPVEHVDHPLDRRRPRRADASRGDGADRPAARPSPRAAAAPSTRSSGRACRARRRPRPRRRASAPRRTRRRRRARASRRAPGAGGRPGCARARALGSAAASDGRRTAKLKRVLFHAARHGRRAQTAAHGRRPRLLELADRLFTGDASIASTTRCAARGRAGRGAARGRVRAGVRQLRRVRDPRRPRRGRHERRVPRGSRARIGARVVARRLDTAIFTHGHIDHVFGVDLYEEEARTNGWAPPRVIAHELIAARFDRYKHHRRLQRGDQPAAVRRRRAAVAGRLPLSRHDLPRCARARNRRRALRAAPRPRRDRRRDVGLGRRPARAVHRRSVRLGVAQLRQPAEGAALRGRLGRRRCARWPRSTPRCCCPGHGLPIVGADRVHQRARSSPRSCSSRCSSRRSR